MRCLPRMRGDRPWRDVFLSLLMEFTPHARGSTSVATIVTCCGQVYPACAGIDLCSDDRNLLRPGLPRMRGDRPVAKLEGSEESSFTPHARGSTVVLCFLSFEATVYPACAGIDHRCLCRVSRHQGLPRMRGDRPGVPGIFPARRKFTPHARGSTRRGEITVLWTIVYPACAGIDLLEGVK